MPSDPSGAPAVELRELTKRFGPVVANAGINLRVERGTIHGVIGENGAGKSTAMKMLYGIYHPDEGEILIDGVPRRWKSPADAIACGIGMVHQHFMLSRVHTALDNLVLGPARNPFKPIDRKAARRKLDEISERYGLPVDWDTPVENLSVGVQQRIEIVKLLYRDARILILDEPTAVLTPQETQDLFAQLRKLAASGRTVIVITHKLKEVMSFTDRVTVFRAGRVTGEKATAETDPQELADFMVGRRVALKVDVPPQPPLGKPVLEVSGLTLRAKGEEQVRHGATPSQRDRYRLFDISLSVRAGEVVGIAGVEGNGQSELLHAIMSPADPECRSAGFVGILGQDVTRLPSGKIRELDVGFIPEDRLHEGLLPEKSVRDNFLLGLQRRPEFQRGGFLRRRAIRDRAMRAIEDYDVRPRSLVTSARGLSGGNQQKLIIAREISGRDFDARGTSGRKGGDAPWLLIAAQPTRGVDVGAIEMIHKRILKARTDGAGVLLVSSELDEILALSDRVLVMYEGAIVGEFARGECDEKAIGLKMGGAGLEK